MNRFLTFLLFGVLVNLSFRASFYFDEQNNIWGYHGFGILGMFIMAMYGDMCIRHYRKTGKS